MNTDGHRCPQADGGGEKLVINDEGLMINDSVHTDETDRTDMSPQAEFKREREFSGIIRELKEIGPQADEECD